MKQVLMGLHKALSTISTKGNDTITMGNCLLLIQQTVGKLEKEEQQNTDEKTADQEDDAKEGGR